MSESEAFAALVELCARLRAPEGCPWDREQTLQSLQPYIIEEAYEVVEAIAAGEAELLAGELGDLLFQIVFAAQIASEDAAFDIRKVCTLVHAKMVRRHPHVFAGTEVDGAAAVVRNWEAIKQRERRSGGALDGVPQHLPALLKTARMTEKAAARGFLWPSEEDAWRRGLDTLGGANHAVRAGDSTTTAGEESRRLGDLLFAIADRARVLGMDAEAALQDANRRFAEAFRQAQAESQP